MLPFLPGRKNNITLAQRLHPSSTPIREVMTLSPEDVPQWIEYSDRFHLLFYDYCNNSRLTHAAEKLRSQFTIFSNLYETETAPQKKINQMHTEIYHAYRSGDYSKAGDLMKLHLQDSLQYALERI